jgi:hypothetical protein
MIDSPQKNVPHRNPHRRLANHSEWGVFCTTNVFGCHCRRDEVGRLRWSCAAWGKWESWLVGFVKADRP